jgi:hypothetical protein
MPVNANSFDQTLRDALIEALREDWSSVLEQSGEIRPSPRQHRRFKKMLANPRGYCRRYLRPDGKRPAPQEDGFVNLVDLRRHKRRILRLAVAAVLAALLAGSALAYSLSGGQFFQWLFRKQAEEDPHDSSYMNTDQLLDMGGSNVGTVLETDEFRFELMDVISSGNTAMAAVRVTAKQMDGFQRDKGRSYSFFNLDGSLMNDEMFSCGWSCRFTDDDGLLQDNQFLLILTATSREDIPAGTYTLVLHDFGYMDGDGKQTVLYGGDWTLKIGLGDGGGRSRTIQMGERYSQDGYLYILDDIRMTPLTMTLNFRCESDENECTRLLFRQFADTACIVLKDGTVISRDQFCCGCSSGGNQGDYQITFNLEFDVPLSVASIQSVTFGDNTIDIGGHADAGADRSQSGNASGVQEETS